ncbi:hypothetical protein PtA15_9A666 [Puccinia triticina]|uniref:Uncharacterized protein n=1 Tax=Puccinia triticina TaxID=208348 RepID=A0ABY7CV76_9BASI|nr:uncharacterized protein PtA15_9A666 [Puccinia triticina]WAQ88539.1 hypothetical protein PtA15_9A666 [Puccinia triticina]
MRPRKSQKIYEQKRTSTWIRNGWLCVPSYVLSLPPQLLSQARTIWRGYGQKCGKIKIEAMETDHKRIVNSIRRVKRRDEFLGEEVEKFDRHVKVLVQARLYDLYADSELSICASHQAAPPPTSPLLSAFNWFVPSLKCFGLDYLIDTHKYRISETNSLGESVDSVAHPDKKALSGFSENIGARTIENENGDESLKRKGTKNREVELHGDPLGLVQNEVFALGELWERLENLILYGITEPCGPCLREVDPVVAHWLSSREEGQLKDDSLSSRLVRDQHQFTMRHFVHAVFRLGKYIGKYNLLPPTFTSKIKLFEPDNLVPIIKFYITQSFQDEIIWEILIWKPQGFIFGLDFLKKYDFFECFHSLIQEQVSSKEYNKIFTHHLIKSISGKFIQEKGMSIDDLGCVKFIRIHEGFRAHEFLEDLNEIDQMLKLPIQGVHKASEKMEIRRHKVFPTIKEMFMCFNEPSDILKGTYQECRLLSIYYMVYFMKMYYKELIDELILPPEIKKIVFDNKIEYMNTFFHKIQENNHSNLKKEIHSDAIEVVNWKAKVDDKFKPFKTN